MLDSNNPLKDWTFWFKQFCWDVYWNENREDSLIRELNKLTDKEGLSTNEAINRIGTEQPHLLREPELRKTPDDFFTEEVEKAARSHKIEFIDAYKQVQEQYPELVKLDELMRNDFPMFLNVCRQLGGRVKLSEEEFLPEFLRIVGIEYRQQEEHTERMIEQLKETGYAT